MKTEKLLTGIGATEPSTFNEICNALEDDIPQKGDKAGWREFFTTLDQAEKDELIETERSNGRIMTAQLTETGRQRVEKYLQERRG